MVERVGMAPRGRTRARMVASAVTLLRERGASAVTIDAVLAHSGTPRGSVYHHFPGGRDELLLAAARAAAGFVERLISDAGDDPSALLDRFAGFWRDSLRDSEFRAGCPIVALAVDARDDLPEAAELVRAAFAAWRDRFAVVLAGTGVDERTARARATLAVAALEGAILLARAEHDTRPLDDTVAELAPLLRPRPPRCG